MKLPVNDKPRHAAHNVALLPYLVLAGAGLIAVLILGSYVTGYTGDIAVTRWLNDLHDGSLGDFTNFIYLILEPPCAIALTLLISTFVALDRGSVWPGLRFGATIALSWIPIIFLKLIFHRPRPESTLLHFPPALSPNDWSFPSGHTAFVTALAMASVSAYTGRHRFLAWVAALLAIASICAVVLINGFHYPTDVLGSLIWVFTMAPLMWAFTGLVSQRMENRRQIETADEELEPALQPTLSTREELFDARTDQHKLTPAAH